MYRDEKYLKEVSALAQSVLRAGRRFQSWRHAAAEWLFLEDRTSANPHWLVFRAGIGQLRKALSGPHADAVLTWLRSRLATASGNFQNALKQREAILSAKEARAAKLSSLASPMTPHQPQQDTPNSGRIQRTNLLRRRGAHATPPPSGGLQFHTPRGAIADSNGGACSVSSAYDACNGHSSGADTPGEMAAQQQQQFWTPRSKKDRQREVRDASPIGPHSSWRALVCARAHMSRLSLFIDSSHAYVLCRTLPHAFAMLILRHRSRGCSRRLLSLAGCFSNSLRSWQSRATSSIASITIRRLQL